MIARNEAPFDLIFIDADKESCPQYLERAVALAREGTLILVDNIVRRGRLIDANTGDAGVDGARNASTCFDGSRHRASATRCPTSMCSSGS